MRKLLVCSIFLLTILPAFAAEDTSTQPKLLNGVHRVVTLGDSITQGGEGPGGYVWLIRHYLKALYPKQDIEVLNAGISGHKSTDMLKRFQKDVIDKKPDLVTISVGVNDVWHGFYDNHPLGDGPNGIPLLAYRKNVEAMITLAQASGAKVVVLSTTVIHEDLKSPENAKLYDYNKALKDLARAHHCDFVDFQKPFKALINAYRNTTGARENLLTGDGVHMNALGNKVMAYTILDGMGISPEAREAVRKDVEAELKR